MTIEDNIYLEDSLGNIERKVYGGSINRISLAYACDESYVSLTLVSMVSVVIHNPGVHFIVLYSKLSKKSKKNFHWISENYLCTVELVELDESIFEGFPLSSWVTVHAWFRIKLADLFPHLERILYLDCDTLVLASLKELWSTDLTNLYIGAVNDIWGTKKRAERLKMGSDTYFNSGVLLINCKKWREEDLFNKIGSYASQFLNLTFCDQDSLNKIIDKEKRILDPKFNLMDTWWGRYRYDYVGEEELKYLQGRMDPVIVHFTGCKPWQRGCKNMFFEEWWKYARKTPIASILLENYVRSVEYKARHSFFRKLLYFHYGLAGDRKIPILTILGKEFSLCR